MQPSQNDKQKYHAQKAGAKRRKVPFNMTFEEWWDWWQATGKYPERGCGKGKYVMARYGDAGPYEIGNIFCCTHETNTQMAQKGRPRSEQWREYHRKLKLGTTRAPHTQKTKDKISAALAGRAWTEEHKANLKKARANRASSPTLPV